MESLTKGLANLLADPVYSDLEIRCGGETFRVHRAVVCARSKVSAAECHVGFQEGAKQVIEHVVFDAATMDYFVQFLYRGDYDVTRAEQEKAFTTHEHSTSAAGTNALVGPSPASAATLLSHVSAYSIADFYELPELKSLAAEKFAKSLDDSDHLSATELLGVISAVYKYAGSADAGLRENVWRVAMERASELASDAAFVVAMIEKEDLKEFALDFIQGFTATIEAEVECEQATSQDTVEELKSKLEDVRRDFREAKEQAKMMLKDLTQKLENAKATLKNQTAAFTRERDAAVAEAKQKSQQLSALADDLQNQFAAVAMDADQKSQQVSDLNGELQQARKDAGAAVRQAKIDAATAVMNQLEDIRRIRSCWGCRQPFCFTLHRYGPIGYMAKCAHCGAKHQKGVI